MAATKVYMLKKKHLRAFVIVLRTRLKPWRAVTTHRASTSKSLFAAPAPLNLQLRSCQRVCFLNHSKMIGVALNVATLCHCWELSRFGTVDGQS